MTNAMIILLESVKLMEAGVLNGTGEKFTVENEDGTKKELEMPEEIHTYAAWKDRGYQVRKGKKAVASFMIWKYKAGKKEETDTEDLGYNNLANDEQLVQAVGNAIYQGFEIRKVEEQ